MEIKYRTEVEVGSISILHAIWPWVTLVIGYVNEYPTMHYFRIPRHTQSMIAYKIFTEYFWKFQLKMHCGNIVNMPYSILVHIS